MAGGDGEINFSPEAARQLVAKIGGLQPPALPSARNITDIGKTLIGALHVLHDDFRKIQDKVAQRNIGEINKIVEQDKDNGRAIKRAMDGIDEKGISSPTDQKGTQPIHMDPETHNPKPIQEPPTPGKVPPGQQIHEETLKRIKVIEGGKGPGVRNPDYEAHKVGKYDLGAYTHGPGGKTYVWTGDHAQRITLDQHGNVLERSEPNLVPSDQGRALPTGSMEFNGHSYLFASVTPLHGFKPEENGLDGNPYIGPNTTVFDVTNPDKPCLLTVFPGVEQVSGTYDPASNRVIFAGNPITHYSSNSHLNANDRYLWSAPASDNQWAYTSNWQLLSNNPIVTNGTRENQITALPGGGILLLSAGNKGHMYGCYADTPEGLVHAPQVELFTSNFKGTLSNGFGDNVHKLPGNYGPEYVDTTINPDGTRTVTFNVSQWINKTNHFNKDMYRTIKYEMTIK